MRSLSATMRKLVMAAGLVFGVTTALQGGVEAGTAPTVLGTVACDPTTGEQLITWRWTNSTSEIVDFDSGVADGSALTAGSIVSPVVGMQPDIGLALQAEAIGETVASPDAVGDVGVTLVWFRTVSQATLQVTGSVLLFGDCGLPDTTVAPTDTTVVPTDTTIIAPPQSTSAEGSGGGTLPHSGGGDDTLLYLGGGLIVIGGSLLVVRRRAAVTS
jgi:LPXTG-motif cell wall-anchored protein